MSPIYFLLAAARERFAKHVVAGLNLGHLDALYAANDGVLGSDEFVDSVIHRIGEHAPKGTPRASNKKTFDPDELLSAVEWICEVAREDLCGKGKGRRLMAARETMILAGRRAGLTTEVLSDVTGLSVATISRRHDAAIRSVRQIGQLDQATSEVLKKIGGNSESSRK